MKRILKWRFLILLAALALAVLYASGWMERIYKGVKMRLVVREIVAPDAMPIAEFEQLHLDRETWEGLRITDGDGNITQLSDLEAPVVFINYWASWCGPCVAEMPGIHGLYEDLKDEVGFVMINSDRTVEKARQYLDREGYPFSVQYWEEPVPEVFKTRSIPMTLVLDRRTGTLYRHWGIVNFDTAANRDFLRRLSR
ncbi:TlpA disulfide reductase family protein [Robiginitalea sp. M366]|uniref:TlpA family protein disulfide reductase n=1 Tax=Robiginitalea aestuariiviva TaxID=3036903 RepID=UPI00240D2E4B|nr:TlpA disulfide reductase family protein [Robiginitalea aestuariiviva]MDG1572660.1 TlpA disulfide reductase family protein [Robiginitalea aestuariiviva]